ncbi:hypothetical protein LY13_001905 [Prauserella aidingensis]|uniref:hypothetical protein n=1 Tax=Prauserella aidingensis TaxID=387890 RepID=UPI0020A52E30|nr:hypothetical protein [Prauserella aidingensis]MCP2253157.1 hypothetical protein [Prauserella aidingensis]
MGSADRHVWAHVDESFPQLPNGRFVYALANVVTDADQRRAIRGELQSLADRDGVRAVHFADENQARRVALAKQVAGLELLGTIVVTQTSAAQKLEDCRSRLLTAAAATLQRTEYVSRLVVESRSQADKNDRKTIDVARSRRQLSGRLTIDFARKSTDPVLWVADVVVSAFTVAEKGGDPEPWEVLNDGQVIDVRRL